MPDTASDAAYTSAPRTRPAVPDGSHSNTLSDAAASPSASMTARVCFVMP